MSGAWRTLVEGSDLAVASVSCGGGEQCRTGTNVTYEEMNYRSPSNKSPHESHKHAEEGPAIKSTG